jgi:hypothetical protein
VIRLIKYLSTRENFGDEENETLAMPTARLICEALQKFMLYKINAKWGVVTFLLSSFVTEYSNHPQK